MRRVALSALLALAATSAVAADAAEESKPVFKASLAIDQ